MERINFKIDGDIKDKFNIAVIENKTDMSSLLRKFIMAYVRNHEMEKKNGKVQKNSD